MQNLRPKHHFKPQPRRHRPSQREMLQAAHRNNQIIFLTMIIPLIIIGLLFPIWPSQAISQDENRALAQRPELNGKEILSGGFSADFDAYYSDQFPFRNSLLSINRGMESVRSFFPQGSGEEIHLITAQKDSGGLGGIENPAANLENNKPIPGEGDTPDAGNSADSGKEQAEDLPVVPREVKATEAQINTQKESDFQTSNIVIIGGRAMEIHYYSSQFTKEYADRINHLAAILPEDRRLISMVVPTAIAYYGTDELRSGMYSNFAAIQNIYKHEEPSIFKVDAYTELAKHTDEYIFFRTDHHWTGRGAYYAYKAFCETMGMEPTSLDDMELTSPEGNFFGSLYGYTNKSSLLIGSEDKAEIFLPKHQAYYEYFSDLTMSDPISGTLLAANVPSDNHYILYLGGDVALGYIKSELENGKSIVVVKDSFGNAFIPYLIDQYEHIYIVDPRQFSDPLLELIMAKDIDDILVMNYTFAVSNPNWLDGFDYIIGYIPKEDTE